MSLPKTVNVWALVKRQYDNTTCKLENKNVSFCTKKTEIS